MKAEHHPALSTEPGDLRAVTLVLPGHLGKDETLKGLTEAIGQVRTTLGRWASLFWRRVEQRAASGNQPGQALGRGHLPANGPATASIGEALTEVSGLQSRYDSVIGRGTRTADDGACEHQSCGLTAARNRHASRAERR